jgi:hypothetical protein
MPKSALVAQPGLCYDRTMKEVVSPDVANKPAALKPRTKKHIIAKPLTAEQISRRIGVTKKDAALVEKVLLRLGYIKDEDLGNGTRKKKAKP